jgi:hypothetical protein
MRIRQIALVARELEPVLDDLRSAFGLGAAFRDPGVATFGLHNAVVPIGSEFLEIVSPVEQGTTAGRLLEKRGGDGGYMVIIQTEDLERARERVLALGVRIVWEVDLGDAATLHLHPRDVGSAILSLDVMHPPQSWRWAGESWGDAVRVERVSGITGARIQCADSEKTAARWAEVLGVDPPVTDQRSHSITVGTGCIRFEPDRDGRGDGLAGVLLNARDPEAILATARARGLDVDGSDVAIGGVVFTLEEAPDPAPRRRS